MGLLGPWLETVILCRSFLVYQTTFGVVYVCGADLYKIVENFFTLFGFYLCPGFKCLVGGADDVFVFIGDVDIVVPFGVNVITKINFGLLVPTI